VTACVLSPENGRFHHKQTTFLLHNTQEIQKIIIIIKKSRHTLIIKRVYNQKFNFVNELISMTAQSLKSTELNPPSLGDFIEEKKKQTLVCTLTRTK